MKQLDELKGTVSDAFGRAAKATGLDKATSTLRRAFYAAVSTKPAGILGLVLGAGIGDAPAGLAAKQTSDLLRNGKKGPTQ
jgi:hypothetical protein